MEFLKQIMKNYNLKNNIKPYKSNFIKNTVLENEKKSKYIIIGKGYP